MTFVESDAAGSLMLQEINEQPEWVARALESERVGAGALAEAVRENDIRLVVIAARGTSETETAQNVHEAQDPARDIPQDLPAPSSPAHDAPAPDAVAAHPAATQPTAHEDPDLQLQPDHPAGRPGPEERAGTGRA